MIATVIAITAVQSQPMIRKARGNVKAPITFGAMAMIIITTITAPRRRH